MLSYLHALCCSEVQPLLDKMLAVIPLDRRPKILNILVDQGRNTLLHLAVARSAVPLTQLLLEMVSSFEMQLLHLFWCL